MRTMVLAALVVLVIAFFMLTVKHAGQKAGLDIGKAARSGDLEPAVEYVVWGRIIRFIPPVIGFLFFIWLIFVPVRILMNSSDEEVAHPSVAFKQEAQKKKVPHSEPVFSEIESSSKSIPITYGTGQSVMVVIEDAVVTKGNSLIGIFSGQRTIVDSSKYIIRLTTSDYVKNLSGAMLEVHCSHETKKVVWGGFWYYSPSGDFEALYPLNEHIQRKSPGSSYMEILQMALLKVESNGKVILDN